MSRPDVPARPTPTLPTTDDPPMPLTRLRAELETAAKKYAAVAQPECPLIHVVLFGREEVQLKHLVICPAPLTPTPPPPPAA